MTTLQGSRNADTEIGGNPSLLFEFLFLTRCTDQAVGKVMFHANIVVQLARSCRSRDLLVSHFIVQSKL